MAMYFIPVNYKDTIAEISKYFLNKNAISENNAIEITPIQWSSMGFHGYPVEKITKRYPFIVEKDGKYWFNEEELNIYYRKQKRKLTYFILIMILIGVLGITLPFLFA